MKTIVFMAFAGLILLGSGCLVWAQSQTSAPKDDDGSAELGKTVSSPAGTGGLAKSAFRVIGYLEGRGRVIIIKAGLEGPVYSVKTSNGKLLFENLSADQLRARAPEVHEFLKTAFAGNSPRQGVTTDASLRIR